MCSRRTTRASRMVQRGPWRRGRASTPGSSFGRMPGTSIAEATVFLLRRTEQNVRRRRGHRPLMGIVLQARHVFAAIDDALDDGAPGGVTAVEVAGPSGSGLTTTLLLAARAARLAGYVPVSSGMLCRDPTIGERLRGRHVCVIATALTSAIERSTLSAFVSQLGAESARRHVLLRFCRVRRTRSRNDRGGSDEWGDVGEHVVRRWRSLSGSGRRPRRRPRVGRMAWVFLDRLGVIRFDRHRSWISMARETSPAYVVSPRLRRRESDACCSMRRSVARRWRVAAATPRRSAS